MTLIIDQTSAKSRQIGAGFVPEIGTASAAPAIADLNESYSAYACRVHVSAQSFAGAHQAHSRRAPRLSALNLLTSEKARGKSEALLEELSIERGLGWTDIARLCGVSISAVRKWRSGGALAPERWRSLSRLAAFLELLEDVVPIGEPAGWLMMPLVERHTVTAADLYREGFDEDILEHAQGNLDVEKLLDRWNSSWRTETRSDWVVVDGTDGGRVIARRT